MTVIFNTKYSDKRISSLFSFGIMVFMMVFMIKFNTFENYPHLQDVIV